MSEFIGSVAEGKEELIDNTPVISLKTDILRNILMFVIKHKETDDLVLLNDAMQMVENNRIEMQ